MGASQRPDVGRIPRTTRAVTDVSRMKVRSVIRTLLVAVVVLAAGATGACEGARSTAVVPSSVPSHSVSPAPQSLLNPHGNVVLCVSNQSATLRRVDITILVDGQPVLAKSFDNRFSSYPKPVVLQLAPGRHVLSAQSTKGDASLQKSFSVNGKRWASVDYWYDNGAHGSAEVRQLVFRIQDRPMLFD